MAFLRTKPNSRFFYAEWADENGRRVGRSTKIEAKAKNRRTAQKVADEYEATSKKKRSARHIRETISSLHKELTGEEFRSATVREYTEQFIEIKKGEISKATLAYYQTGTRDFLKWIEDKADRDIADIVPSDISGFRNYLLLKVSETTANHKIKAIRAMFTSAHKEGLCLEEPTSGLKLGRKAKQGEFKQERRAFTLDELKLISEESTGEWKSMIMFGLYTGQRLGDLATLRWTTIDLVRNEVRLSTRKTGKRINIPISAPLQNHIATLDIPNDDPSAFVHPTIAMQYEKQSSTVSNQFNKLLANCGLRKPVSHRSKGVGRDNKREETVLSFHSLRATAVTLMHEAGIPAAVVENWVGHNSVEVHKAYIKLGKETMQTASDALPDIG